MNCATAKATGSETDAPKTWRARWIEPVQDDVTEEPPFSLADMFAPGAKMPEQTPPEERLHPCPLLKRTFKARARVAKATLSITAHGLYQARINGEPVCDAVFTPDFTSYEKILMYQTYDVTDLVREGDNVWTVVLADGWWAGRIAVQGNSRQFGTRLALLGELELAYDDGTTEVVCTDGSFRCSTGKYVYADIQIGEKQDLRLERKGWDTEASCEGWQPVAEVAFGPERLVPQLGPQVVRRETLACARVWSEGDSLVVDFGQVIAGRIQITCALADGQVLTVEHAEVLDADGRFFRNIIGRNKDATDVFVGRGGIEALEPDFTFHGFRYARITGWRGDFDPSCIKAVALRSDLDEVGCIETSDERVNRLVSNVLWSQRGNMLSIPTDCPQRERMGWTGDIQVFAPTGCFFMDLDLFLTRWLDQVMADQLDDGEIVDYSPMPASAREQAGFIGARSSAGWGDAVILVPWELYRQYGDSSVLERCYDAMLRWHEHCVESAAGEKDGDDRYVWDTAFHYGDWMLPSMLAAPDADPLDGARMTKDIVATCFLAHATDVLAEISDLLGHGKEADEQRAYAAHVRAAFPGRFYLGGGAMSVELQGCYVLPLAFDMLPEAERQAVADHLAEMVRANGDRLDTGFLSVPYLLDVLGRFGHGSLAEDLFWQSDCPSWLYEVDHGATTIWENWVNVAPDGTVGAFSFNHYALGCVAEWIVRHVGGLEITEPAYRRFEAAPHFIHGLSHVSLAHRIATGVVKVAWRSEGGGHRVDIEVPEGSEAHVVLPGVPERVCGPGSHVLFCA